MFSVNTHFDNGVSDSFGYEEYTRYVDAACAAYSLMKENVDTVSIMIIDEDTGEDRFFAVPGNTPLDVAHVLPS